MDYKKFIKDRITILSDFLDIDLKNDEILEIVMSELDEGNITLVELSSYGILKDKIDWDRKRRNLLSKKRRDEKKEEEKEAEEKNEIED